jgi:hypothetical protein
MVMQHPAWMKPSALLRTSLMRCVTLPRTSPEPFVIGQRMHFCEFCRNAKKYTTAPRLTTSAVTSTKSV